TVRLFVLPTGRLGPSLAPAEAELLGPLLLGDESASHSLVALGCLGANAIVAPSPSAARATEGDPGLASRASDEPVIADRFGCDSPPNDPANDPALPANFRTRAGGQGGMPARHRTAVLAGARAAHVVADDRTAARRRRRRGRDPGRHRTAGALRRRDDHRAPRRTRRGGTRAAAGPQAARPR